MNHYNCGFYTFISHSLSLFNYIHRIYRVLYVVIYHLIFKSSYSHYVTDLRINGKNISSNWQPHLMVVLTTKYSKFHWKWSDALHLSCFAVYLLLCLWQQGSHIHNYKQGSLFPCSRTCFTSSTSLEVIEYSHDVFKHKHNKGDLTYGQKIDLMFIRGIF